MGEVYRARDTKLNRDVALKILPSEFLLNDDRVARFRREAQVLASLNHPHIAAIYGFEDSGETHALVLELVEGPTLADRIAKGPIPLDEALPIAKQVAEALEAAHEQGIIHRDLKPSNIKVREDGTAKVLDFGLAKALEPASSVRADVTNSPTITTSPALMTGVGMLLGTAAYMSPEQAKGRPADKRSDIWAFGCVLYEMLTGQRAFDGEDVSDTLAAVLRGEPAWAALPPEVPAGVRALLVHCLRRDRHERIADISTARFVIDEGTVADTTPTSAAMSVRAPVWQRAVPFVVTAVLSGGLVGGIAWRLKPPITSVTVTRFPLRLPEGQQFTNPGRQLVAISPDGTLIAYVANQSLYVRSLLSENEATPIEGSHDPGGITSPTFAPDGRSIAFVSGTDRAIKRIAVSGGVAVTVCPIANSLGVNWGVDGIVFAQRGIGIMRVSPNGGQKETLVTVKTGEVPYGPQLLPDGRSVLFTLVTGAGLGQETGNNFEVWDKAKIVVQSLQSGARTTLIDGGADARYVPTGHLAYAVGGVLFAVPFDQQRLRVVGERVALVEGVSRGGATGAAHYSFSNTGSLVFVPGPVSIRQRTLVWIDRKGAIERLALHGGLYESPRVSPDGKIVAVGIDDGKDGHVWMYDLTGATSIRQLTVGGRNRFPVWSPDGQHVAYQSDRQGDTAVFWQRADGRGTAERLTTAEQGTTHIPWSWSPDAKQLLVGVSRNGSTSLSLFSLQDKRVAPFGNESSDVIEATFSPDGHWVAYAVASAQVTVEPFPVTGEKYPVSSGAHPMWSHDGKELFLAGRGPGIVEMVHVRTQPSFAFSDRTTLSATLSLLAAPRSPRNYDITPDGTRFITVLAPGQQFGAESTSPQINVTLNWFEELKQRVPVK
jgi:serine/threonine-protein kinase